MQVKVANKIYRMNRKEYQGLRKIASDQVPFGVYALEKEDYAELRCDRCNSMTQLKKLTRQFHSQGFKVLSNKGDCLKEAAGDAAKEVLRSAT